MPMPKLVCPFDSCSDGLPLMVAETPIRCAVSATLLGPTSAAIWSKVVFSEYFIALATVTCELLNTASLGSLQIRVPSIVTHWLPLTTESMLIGVVPDGVLWVSVCPSAVASVYGLNDEPGAALPSPA